MLILLSKLTRVGSNSTEVKIIQRGQYYLTPFQPYHIDEVVEHLSSENIEELALLGYTNIREAITDMYETSECYIARKEGETFLAVGGLWYNEDQDCPQMFAMFSDNIKKSFTAAARGSRMVVDFFDKTQPMMTMTILQSNELILNWAVWLGFDPVGFSEQRNHKYVEFVRCNPNKNNVSDRLLQPVIH